MNPDDRQRHYVQAVWPKLQALGDRICDAEEREDERLIEHGYGELIAFYESQTAAGFWHPGLTEALADFTEDPAAAVEYYRKALAEARELEEQTHSILIDLAERLIELGELEEAEACLREGHSVAKQAGDADYVGEAERIAREVGLGRLG